jgi:hypothetical protein
LKTELRNFYFFPRICNISMKNKPKTSKLSTKIITLACIVNLLLLSMKNITLLYYFIFFLKRGLNKSPFWLKNAVHATICIN